jgi:hypothetical protein
VCVSAAPAYFSDTVLYVGRVDHPVLGHIEVLGYQNTAVNLARGPNAMLLHLPAVAMSPANFLDTTANRSILRDMARVTTLARPPVAGSMEPYEAPPIQVFDHDIYTVVLANDPRGIPAALDTVPSHRRPRVHRLLLDFYAHTYPGYPVALCCFDNADARRAAPLLLWYPPRDPIWLVTPAIDCHTGRPPNPNDWVRIDHHLIVGLPVEPTQHVPGPRPGLVNYIQSPVYYTQPAGALAAFLPNLVAGYQFIHRLLPNGDFAVSAAEVQAGRLGPVYRRLATGALVPV